MNVLGNVPKRISRRLKRLICIMALPHTRHLSRIKYDKNRRQRSAQEEELTFHQNNAWRASSRFMAQTKSLFAYFGFSSDDYEEKTIIDLGAGSKLRTKYFTAAKIIAIEPLAERFMKTIQWCDLSDAEKVFSSPAEDRINECVNIADLVISINVLDHCYDFERIIDNIAAYLNTGALAFLSFDKHKEADDKHPLILTETICETVFAQKGLIVEKSSKGAGKLLRTYGHGDYCLNYWLRKAQQDTTDMPLRVRRDNS